MFTEESDVKFTVNAALEKVFETRESCKNQH